MRTSIRWIIVPFMALVMVLPTTIASHASPITSVFTFSASGFVCFSGCPAVPPTDPVAGSATLTLDPAGPDVFDQPFSNFSLTIAGNVFPLASVGFTYFSVPDILLFGDLTFGVQITGDGPDWVMVIHNATSAAPSLFDFLYGIGPSQQFRTSTGIVTSTTIPEPSTLAIFALGLAGLGFMRRRRRVA